MKLATTSILAALALTAEARKNGKSKGGKGSSNNCAEEFVGIYEYVSQGFGSLYVATVGYNSMTGKYEFIDITPQCYVPNGAPDCDETTNFLELDADDFYVNDDGMCAFDDKLFTCIQGSCTGYSLGVAAYQVSDKQWALCFSNAASRPGSYNCNSETMQPRAAMRK